MCQEHEACIVTFASFACSVLALPLHDVAVCPVRLVI